MINLLPKADQKNLRAARANTLLLRYTIALLIASAFMIVAIVVTYFVLIIGRSSSENTIAENTAKQGDYAQVKQESTEFNNNLATAKQIFDGQINYSGLILDIARTVPRGIVLENLALDSTTFGQPTTLTARASSYDAALRLKDTFGANTKLFNDVSIQSITSDETTGRYPLSVTINLTINKDAAS